jgi:hypothetical protein
MAALTHRHCGRFLEIGNVGPAISVMSLVALHAGRRILRRLGLPSRKKDMEMIVEVLPGRHIGMALQAMLVAQRDGDGSWLAVVA